MAGPPRIPRGGSPIDMLRNQSGSGVLMTRALGATRQQPGQATNTTPLGAPQNMPRITASGLPPNQVNGNRRPMPGANQSYSGGVKQQGSGQQGSFYADQPSQPEQGTYYTGDSLWHSDYAARAATPRVQPQGIPTGSGGPYQGRQPQGGVGMDWQNKFGPGFIGSGNAAVPGNNQASVVPGQSQSQSSGLNGGGAHGSNGPSGPGAGKPRQQNDQAGQRGALPSAGDRSPLGQSFNARQMVQAGEQRPDFTQQRGQGNGFPAQQGQGNGGFSIGGGPTQNPNRGNSPRQSPAGVGQAGSNVGSSQSNLVSGDANGGSSDTRKIRVNADGSVDNSDQAASAEAQDQAFSIMEQWANTDGESLGKQGEWHLEDDGHTITYSSTNGKNNDSIDLNDPATWPDWFTSAWNNGKNVDEQSQYQASVADANKPPEEDFNVGAPPQFDESAMHQVDQTTRANFARQKARALRSAAEAGAYGGAGADQMAAALGDTTTNYGIAAEAEVARNNLQLKIQNFQAQMDWYGKAFQAEMARYQTTQDRRHFDEAMKFAKYGNQLKQQLMDYQNQLDNTMTSKDWLGAALGWHAADLQAAGSIAPLAFA